MKRTNTKSISDVLGDFVKESSLEEGLLRTRIFEAWDLLLSGQLSSGGCTTGHTYRDSVLTCRIRSSVVRSHLRTQEAQLRFQLNKMLQGEYVKQIKFI